MSEFIEEKKEKIEEKLEDAGLEKVLLAAGAIGAAGAIVTDKVIIPVGGKVAGGFSGFFGKCKEVFKKEEKASDEPEKSEEEDNSKKNKKK